MRGLELGYNVYLASVLYRISGIKTTLNATQIATRGAGLNGTEAMKLASMAKKKNLMKAVKNAFMQIIKP